MLLYIVSYGRPKQLRTNTMFFLSLILPLFLFNIFILKSRRKPVLPSHLRGKTPTEYSTKRLSHRWQT